MKKTTLFLYVLVAGLLCSGMAEAQTRRSTTKRRTTQKVPTSRKTATVTDSVSVNETNSLTAPAPAATNMNAPVRSNAGMDTTVPVNRSLAEREAPIQPVQFQSQRVDNAEQEQQSWARTSVPDQDQMYRTTLWRRMDLRETMNQPFFARNNEISRFLLEGVKSGVIKAYANDSLTRELSLDQVNANLRMEGAGSALSQEEIDAGFGQPSAAEDGWGNAPKKTNQPVQNGQNTQDDGWGGTTTVKKPNNQANMQAPGGKPGSGKPLTALDSARAAFEAPQAVGAEAYEYFPTDLNVLEIKEDYIFDKRRSRPYFDIKTISMIIPAAKTAAGFDRIVATFDYNDIQRYFRSDPKKFVWYNNANMAQHLNMADAFDLRLFNARIYKQSNANDQDLAQIYGSEKAGLLQGQQLEYKLLEWEHNLWEY